MRSFVRDGAATVAINAMTLALNVLTGIIVARSLGPDGRGALTAVLVAPPVFGWLLGMGSSKAATYFISKDPTLGARLFTTWLVMMIPIGAMAVTIGEISLSTLLSAQSEETLFLARLYMPTVVVVLLSDLVFGIILGDQRFLYFNALCFVQPIGATAAYVVLWLSGGLTVASAIVTQALVGAAVLAAGTVYVVRRHGLAWPDMDIARSTLWYGLRTHGEIIGGTLTQRLDLMILPAFLTAASVGFYAIATNVSGIVVTVSGALSTILLPAAAHRGESGRALVIKSLHGALLIGAVSGGGLSLFAESAIGLVYGAEFLESVLPLRILLPGAVLYAAASVLINGLYAENRPFTATLSQLLGLVATVVGLFAFLRSGGVLAAAIVSTVAYFLVFVAAGVLYRHVTGLSWQAFLPAPSDFRMVLRHLLTMLHIGSHRVSDASSASKAND